MSFMSIACLSIIFVGWKYVMDCNKLLDVIISISAFCFFKNLHVRKSKVINYISASTFGILLIHDNSWASRRFLWHEIVGKIEYTNIILFSLFSITIIYLVCFLFDKLRYYILEVPVLKLLDYHIKKVIIKS